MSSIDNNMPKNDMDDDEIEVMSNDDNENITDDENDVDSTDENTPPKIPIIAVQTTPTKTVTPVIPVQNTPTPKIVTPVMPVQNNPTPLKTVTSVMSVQKNPQPMQPIVQNLPVPKMQPNEININELNTKMLMDIVEEENKHIPEYEAENEEEVPNEVPRKKRGLPKTMMANQLKYMDALEKQRKMMGGKKDKKKQPTNNKKEKEKQPVVEMNTTGTRRVVIAGKVKFLPIKTNNPGEDIVVVTKEPTIKKIETVSSLRNNDMNKQALENSIPSRIIEEIKKPSIRSEPKKNTQNTGKKIPSKYAKQVENDVKKQTVRNVKNFSDLRRVKAMENVTADADIDANKASIIELRKLRIEQRKKEQADLKKKNESKRDNAVQEILKNDKMSKFAKAVAIKNLSVNSRTKTRNPGYA